MHYAAIDLSYKPPSFSSYLNYRKYAASDTLLILDFDDTIFPTTYLERHGITTEDDANISQRETIARAERRTLRLLDSAAATRTAIVTTASSGWVDDAMAEWMPTLASRYVPVISASEQYANTDSDSYDRKLWAFRELHKEQREDLVVVVGDGAYEKWAAESMSYAEDADIALVESIDYPEPEQIVAQMEFTRRALNAVTERYQPAHFRLYFS